jgi:hypothetical protein
MNNEPNKSEMATPRKPSDQIRSFTPAPPFLRRSREFHGYAHDDESTQLEGGFFCPMDCIVP